MNGLTLPSAGILQIIHRLQSKSGLTASNHLMTSGTLKRSPTAMDLGSTMPPIWSLAGIIIKNQDSVNLAFIVWSLGIPVLTTGK